MCAKIGHFKGVLCHLYGALALRFKMVLIFDKTPLKWPIWNPNSPFQKLGPNVFQIYIYLFFFFRFFFFFLQSFHFKIEIFQQRVLFNNSFIILLASYYSLFICSSGLRRSIFLDEVGFRIAPKKGRSPTNLLKNKRVNHLKKSSVLYVFCVFC